MVSKTANKLAPEACARAVRLVLDHEGSTLRAGLRSVAKIGYTSQTLHECVKAADRDGGRTPALLRMWQIWRRRRSVRTAQAATAIQMTAITNKICSSSTAILMVMTPPKYPRNTTWVSA